MANKFDKGMDDCYLGKEIKGDPGLEYLQGYGYAENLLQKEQYDNRVQIQPDDRQQQNQKLKIMTKLTAKQILLNCFLGVIDFNEAAALGAMEKYAKQESAELLEALIELVECDYTSGTHLYTATLKAREAIKNQKQ